MYLLLLCAELSDHGSLQVPIFVALSNVCLRTSQSLICHPIYTNTLDRLLLLSLFTRNYLFVFQPAHFLISQLFGNSKPARERGYVVWAAHDLHTPSPRPALWRGHPSHPTKGQNFD